MTGILYGVGIGPGDPELLTVKAVRILKDCPVIAAPQTASGATLALDIVAQALDVAEKRIIPLSFSMSHDAQVLEESHRKAAKCIITELERGFDVALLNLGDVSIFATFNHVKPYIEAAGHRTAMIPGIPSFCAVAAALDTNLTPGMNTPLHIIPAGFTDLAAALDLPGTKVVMKAGKPLEKLKQALRSTGRYKKASLVQNCGLPDEYIAHSLDDAKENGGYFTTVVVQP